MLKVLDLFSGIGGFSLGLERTGGFETVAFCEIDPFCRKVLAKHWPGVPIYEDVRTLKYDRPVDLICGGFPCQDISTSKEGADGIDGERSGLWKEFARLVCEIRPRYVLVENVGRLLDRGLGRILADLATIGFDAEWCVLSASFVGAPHARDRTWIIAYPNGSGLEGYKSFWEDVRSNPGTASAEFGDRSIPCGLGWPFIGGHLRVGNGVRREVDEIRSLGNAVVPQIPEILGHAILEAEGLK